MIEATTSNRRQKAVEDGGKLDAACRELQKRYPFKGTLGFFITQGEPTADQRKAIRAFKTPLQACSFAQFYALLVDAREYVECRKKYPFGSARDPKTDDAQALDQYETIDLVDDNGTQHSVSDIAALVQQGRRVALLGDYGAGKSMTLREVFLHLAEERRRRRLDSSRFCSICGTTRVSRILPKL